MSEIKKFEQLDVNRNILEDLKKFKSEKNISFENAKKYIENLFNENQDNFYTEYKDRYDKTPVNNELGFWEGERAESKFIPSSETEKGRNAIEKLSEYGLDGITYKNAEPDFSKCNEGTVEIENMTPIRPYNFEQADKKLAEQWNNNKKDSKINWTAEDVSYYREKNFLTWHECSDTKTMQLVSRHIHGGATSVFPHSGGIAECKARDEVKKGGTFDE